MSIQFAPGVSSFDTVKPLKSNKASTSGQSAIESAIAVEHPLVAPRPEHYKAHAGLLFGAQKSKAEETEIVSDENLFKQMPILVQTWLNYGLPESQRENKAKSTFTVEHLLLGIARMAQDAIETIPMIEDPDVQPVGDQRKVLSYRMLIGTLFQQAYDPDDDMMDDPPESSKVWEMLEDSLVTLKSYLKHKATGRRPKEEVRLSPSLRKVMETYEKKYENALFSSGDLFFNHLISLAMKASKSNRPAELALAGHYLKALAIQYEGLFYPTDFRREVVEELNRPAKDKAASTKAAKEVEAEEKPEPRLSPRQRTIRQWYETLENAHDLPEGKRLMTDKQYTEIKELLDRYVDLMPESDYGEANSELKNLHDRITAIMKLPWQRADEKPIDLVKVETLLNKNHYGLRRAKNRILEFMSVAKRQQQMSKSSKTQKSRQPDTQRHLGKILCLVGPKGTGKTTLARAIAEGTGRKYVKISMNGITDVSKLKGDRGVYVGAGMGEFFKTITKAGTNNPVMLLDEFDKMKDVPHHGDPRQALLDLLDPEQNHAIHDDYAGVDYDFSNVLFILTANSLDELSGPLLDRLEIINLRGYTDEEKVEIARRHLVPRRMKENGLTTKEMFLPKRTLRTLAHIYTPEGGVRSLERKIDQICRKVVDRRMRKQPGQSKLPRSIGSELLHELLGPPPQFETVKMSRVGRVNGLYYSENGGGILPMLVRSRPEPMHRTEDTPGTLKMVDPTGNMHKVMVESVKTAFGYVDSHLEALSEYLGKPLVPNNTITKLYVGAEEGAIDKDGNSAGAATALAMVSRLADIPVRGDTAMTGTITYDGEVGAIGGLMEKITGAARAGARRVLIPISNYDAKTDSVIEYNGEIVHIPVELRKKVKIIPVSHFTEVLDLALTKTPKRSRRKTT